MVLLLRKLFENYEFIFEDLAGNVLFNYFIIIYCFASSIPLQLQTPEQKVGFSLIRHGVL